MQQSPRGPAGFGIRVGTRLVLDRPLPEGGPFNGLGVGILASPNGSITGLVDPVSIFEPDREATSVYKGASIALPSFVGSSTVEPITPVSIVDRGFFERGPFTRGFLLMFALPLRIVLIEHYRMQRLP